MREIKFRAFWKDTLKPVLDFQSEYVIDSCNDEILIVNQYTGLKDKNGKDIYEGDIVNQPSWWWGAGEVKPYYSYGGQDLHWIAGDNHNYWNLDEIEVIGNIYENPNLITPHTEEKEKE